MGKLLHVFSYQLLTSEVLAVFVLTEQISHQNTPKKPCVPFPMRNLYASVCTCAQPHTAADRYSRFHEAGSHEGSLTKDCGSAGRKWSTPLDMNRKQPGKRTLTGHTHSESYGSSLNTDQGTKCKNVFVIKRFNLLNLGIL